MDPKWSSTWNTGKNHHHEDSVLHSKMSSSEYNLYFSHKDHKKEVDKI